MIDGQAFVLLILSSLFLASQGFPFPSFGIVIVYILDPPSQTLLQSPQLPIQSTWQIKVLHTAVSLSLASQSLPFPSFGVVIVYILDPPSQTLLQSPQLPIQSIDLTSTIGWFSVLVWFSLLVKIKI